MKNERRYVERRGIRYRVELFNVITTRTFVCNVFAPVPKGDIMNQRGSTISHEEGMWWERVGTDPDPYLYDHLPAGSDERIAAAQGAYQDRYDLAYAVIETAFPEIAWSRRDAGECEIQADVER